MYPNRLVCSVLEEMRKQLEQLDEHNIDRYKSIHAMMIEEAQTMVNRMEEGLENGEDITRLQKKRNELNKEVNTLKEERDKLKGEKSD